jgi:Fic family protein
MIVYTCDTLPDVVRGQLDELDHLAGRLGRDVAVPRPWVGTLRRQARAEAARSSIAIEGYPVGEADAVALLEGGSGRGSAPERAFEGYAHAMHHVAVLAEDPSFTWVDRVVLDLHFDACAWQPTSRPGRWRLGPVSVTAPGGGVAYQGPDAADVPALTAALIASLACPAGVHVAVRAAIAHLNLVSIHPFQDGNGRVSRILQSLVLALDGRLAPEFGSIEQHLASDTAGYYAALREVQGGRWQPDRDPTSWVDYCVGAHVASARRRLGLVEAAARRWAVLEDLVAARGWPERLVIALERACVREVERAGYAREAEVSPATASGDLRRLVDAGWLERRGSTKDARYVPSTALWERVDRR